MNSILLYSFANERIKVTIEAFFDAKNNLVIEGYDIGKAAEEYWGDSDYEYTTTVAPEEVEKLYSLFNLPNDSQLELLAILQFKFNTNTCYSQLGDFLRANNIKSEGFSWS